MSDCCVALTNEISPAVQMQASYVRLIPTRSGCGLFTLSYRNYNAEL